MTPRISLLNLHSFPPAASITKACVVGLGPGSDEDWCGDWSLCSIVVTMVVVGTVVGEGGGY